MKMILRIIHTNKNSSAHKFYIGHRMKNNVVYPCLQEHLEVLFLELSLAPEYVAKPYCPCQCYKNSKLEN